MKKQDLYALGLLTFLLALSTICPVIANDWGSPLATDPSGDAGNSRDDIQSVDARYANELVYFRFKMNNYLNWANYYMVKVDFDKNVSSGETSDSDSDIGYEFSIYCGVNDYTPYIETEIEIDIYGGSSYSVRYNMTAGGTAFAWNPDPSVEPYFDMTLFMNNSQGDVVFGLNWTWLTEELAGLGVEGDNCTMYLEFEVGGFTDWCPDRTGGTTDYIEWDLYEEGDGGFPWLVVGIIIGGLAGLTAVIFVMRKRGKA